MFYRTVFFKCFRLYVIVRETLSKFHHLVWFFFPQRMHTVSTIILNSFARKSLPKTVSVPSRNLTRFLNALHLPLWQRTIWNLVEEAKISLSYINIQAWLFIYFKFFVCIPFDYYLDFCIYLYVIIYFLLISMFLCWSSGNNNNNNTVINIGIYEVIVYNLVWFLCLMAYQPF